jgi:hypothetical protein
MAATHSSKREVKIYQVIWCNMPEDSNLQEYIITAHIKYVVSV